MSEPTILTNPNAFQTSGAILVLGYVSGTFNIFFCLVFTNYFQISLWIFQLNMIFAIVGFSLGTLGLITLLRLGNYWKYERDPLQGKTLFPISKATEISEDRF